MRVKRFGELKHLIKMLSIWRDEKAHMTQVEFFEVAESVKQLFSEPQVVIFAGELVF